jgi:hypothetical protein
MSGVQTATVETLTAEVHVLKVGSRQITLSVAKQLDEVPYKDMEPMGRVRINRIDPLNFAGVISIIEVIGRHRQTNSLVYSSVYMFVGEDYRLNDDERRWLYEEAEELPLIVLAGLK